MKPVVIIIAVNGGAQQSRDGAYVPITPEQIAEEAELCRQAGASVLHFHGRDKEGNNTGDPAVYTDIIRAVRKQSNIVLQSTNGIGSRFDKKTGQWWFPSDEERLALLKLNPPPDYHGAAIGSIDFYHPDGGYAGEATFPNSGHFLQETIRTVYGRGSSIEFEVPHGTALHRLHRYLIEGGVDPKSPYIGFVAPLLPGFCPDFRHFMFVADEMRRLFPNAWRSCGGAGKLAYPAVTLGLALDFECVRVGFEDGLYLPDGSVAKRNVDLVQKVVEIAAIYGRRPASPDEARQILHLGRNQPRTNAA